jgi:hypothetical protein
MALKSKINNVHNTRYYKFISIVSGWKFGRKVLRPKWRVQRHYANRLNANRLNANFTISGPMPTVRMPTNPNANLKIELTTPN